MLVTPLDRVDEFKVGSFDRPSENSEGLQADEEVGEIGTLCPPLAQVHLVRVPVEFVQGLSTVEVLHPHLTRHGVLAVAP